MLGAWFRSRFAHLAGKARGSVKFVAGVRARS